MLGEFLLGVLAGTITGATPGLHVNTVASMVYALNKFKGFGFVIFVYTMGLIHTFLDPIPSTFFGVPDEDTLLSVLPAHKLVLKGRALEVINISLKASSLAVIFAFLFLPLYFILAPQYNPKIGKCFILFLTILLVLTEKGIKKVVALFVFLISGVLGILIDYLPLREPYFHVFVGLFGIPTILYSLYKDSDTIQLGRDTIEMKTSSLVGFSLLGTFLGMFASLLPAFTSSQAALMGSFISKDERSFLTISFSVNTANFFFSLFNFYITGRARNGIMAVIRDSYYNLSSKEMLILILLSISAVSFVNIYGLKLAKIFGILVSSVNYRILNLFVMMFMVSLSFYFDGWIGVLVLMTASLIGLFPLLLGVKRTNCMGVLMVKIMIKN